MRAGDLNRMVRIEKRGAKTGLNAPSQTWELHATVWASIKTQSGMGAAKQMSANGVTSSAVQYSVRIRYRTTVKADMRVVTKDGTIFDIKQVRHDMADREYTDLVCVQGQNDG